MELKALSENDQAYLSAFLSCKRFFIHKDFCTDIFLSIPNVTALIQIF